MMPDGEDDSAIWMVIAGLMLVIFPWRHDEQRSFSGLADNDQAAGGHPKRDNRRGRG